MAVFPKPGGFLFYLRTLQTVLFQHSVLLFAPLVPFLFGTRLAVRMVQPWVLLHLQPPHPMLFPWHSPFQS